MAPTGIQGRLRAGLAELLADAGVVSWDTSGTYLVSQSPKPCYDTSYPDNGPDVCVALATYYTGGDGVAGDATTWLQLQVRTRGQKHGPSTDADDLDDAIAQVLLGNYPLTLPNGVRLSKIEHTSSTPIGRDAAGRFERTTNWSVRVYDAALRRV